MMGSAELLLNHVALVFYSCGLGNPKIWCNEEDGCVTSGGVNGTDTIEINGVAVIYTS